MFVDPFQFRATMEVPKTEIIIHVIFLDFRAMNKGQAMGYWMAIGIAIGTALGAAMDNIGLGIALGVGIGAAFGAGIGNRKKKDNSQ